MTKSQSLLHWKLRFSCAGQGASLALDSALPAPPQTQGRCYWLCLPHKAVIKYKPTRHPTELSNASDDGSPRGVTEERLLLLWALFAETDTWAQHCLEEESTISAARYARMPGSSRAIRSGPMPLHVFLPLGPEGYIIMKRELGRQKGFMLNLLYLTCLLLSKYLNY